MYIFEKKLHFTTTNDFPTYEYDDYKFIQLGYLLFWICDAFMGPTNVSDYSLSKYKDFMILNSFLEKIENFNFDYRALMVAKLVSHLIRKHAILCSRRPPHTSKDFGKSPMKIPCHETLHGVYQHYGGGRKNRGKKICIVRVQ